MKKFNVRTIMTICFLLIGIWVVITALQWPLRTAFFPVIMGSIFIILNIMELVMTLYSVKWSKEKRSGYDFKFAEGIDPALVKKRGISISCWILFYYFCIHLVGFSYAIPLFFLLFFRMRGEEAWKLSIALAAVAWVSFHGLFVMLLKMQYPEGWLQQGLIILLG